jgi:glycosyltransferase involved in cell wall biosynthesis
VGEGARTAMTKTAVISINTAWNIVNFRGGLIRALQADGFRVVAIAPPDAYSPRLAAMDVGFEPIAIDSKGLSPAGDLRLVARYRALFRRLKPDVYLGWTAKPNIWGSLAAHAAGVPAINNISGLGTAFIAGGWLGATVSALYRLALSRSATVFFQNAEDRDLFVQRKLVRAGRTGVLPGSGIDTDRFAPRPGRAEDGSFVFLLPARLLWDKGVAEFVEAARAVRAERPATRFQLLGFLDVENRTAVPRAAVDAWVAEGLIEYLGATDDVRPPLAAADCVVLPSYREGLPRSLLEGAAMARPLIAADAPGCRDVVRDGVNGYLCAVRDAASLADAMRRMIALPPEARAALGAAGHGIAEAEFAEGIVVARYRAAIAAALAGG